MKPIRIEIKEVIRLVKEAQSQFQTLIKNHDWIEEAQKYAKRQGKEVKKLFSADIEKLKTFLEKERKDLAYFQKQIPGELKKFKKFLALQGKEFEKVLSSLSQVNPSKTSARSSKKSKKKSKSARESGRKKTTPPAAEQPPASVSSLSDQEEG